RHARIIDEGERGRQGDGPGVGPALSFLGEELHPAAAGLPAPGTAFALIALAQRQDVIPIIAAYMGHRFKALVAALEGEVERPLLAKMELVVILDEHGPVAAAGVLACLHQQVKTLLGRVIGNALKAEIAMRQATEPVGRTGLQVARKPAN